MVIFFSNGIFILSKLCFLPQLNIFIIFGVGISTLVLLQHLKLQ
jgi:hypothetical protein